MSINILFTGAGRRIELIQAFREAALVKNVDLKIFGADMSGMAPALSYCDKICSICNMKDPAYVDELLEICKKNDVNMVIPTIDTDLLVLSKEHSRFEELNIKLLLSSYDKILVCRDKNNTGTFFRKCGLNAPDTYNDHLKYKGDYPCFIKPKDGSSSINAYKVKDYKELEIYAKMIGDYIIQPYISGTEYTVDIMCDYNGDPIYITPRIRQAVRAGEVLKTRIDLDERIINEAKALIKEFKPCGPITVQLIREESTGEDYYIEINPRFGGGAPLSMHAGAKSAEAVLGMLSGEQLSYKPDVCADGAEYSRYDQCVCVKKGVKGPGISGIIFDLDDTLYSEEEYIRSGYKKIAELIGDKDGAERLWTYHLQGVPAIDHYLDKIGRTELKETCLSVYREQNPDIHMIDGVAEILKRLREKGIKTGIITDGRVSGQKKKLEALGLDKIIDDIIITDELGGSQFRKPNDISFRIIQNRWRIPFEQIAYIGDNPLKDFIAPGQLGMRAFFYNNPNGLYSGNPLYDTRIITLNDWSDFEKYIDTI